MMCGGNRSGRVDMIWPTLTNVAPSAMSSVASRSANHACARGLAAERHEQAEPAEQPDEAVDEQQEPDQEATTDEAKRAHGILPTG